MPIIVIDPDKPQPRPEPPPPPPLKAITRDTPFRQIPPLSADRVREILKGYPMEPEAAGITLASGGSALALAQSYKESQYGKTAGGNNPLGLMQADGRTLMTFSTWAQAFREWKMRIDDPTYKGGVYQPQDMSLAQYIFTYVGGPGCWSSKGTRCANGETSESVSLYLQQTIDRINRYFGLVVPDPTPQPGGKSYAVGGISETITLPFPLVIKLIPPSQTRQRPGIPMTPDRYIQHETGNPNPSAGALMHQQYLLNGAEGQQLGYHFTVDDTMAYQMIPANEVTWHGGDGSGPCNFKGLSCELCINHPVGSARDRQAQENAAILAAELMNALDLDLLKPHVECIGTDHHCPDRILRQAGGFGGFRDRVMRLRSERR